MGKILHYTNKLLVAQLLLLNQIQNSIAELVGPVCPRNMGCGGGADEAEGGGAS